MTLLDRNLLQAALHRSHRRGWLKPENRCRVPFNSFAEYASEPNPETKKKESSGLPLVTIGR